MWAQIKEKREIAKRTLFVTFDLLGRQVDFKPGQYFWVTLGSIRPTTTRRARDGTFRSLPRRASGAFWAFVRVSATRLSSAP
jgi:NAD(P)H-flavin reductase